MACSFTSLLCSTQKASSYSQHRPITLVRLHMHLYFPNSIYLINLSWFVLPNKILWQWGALFLFIAVVLGPRIKPGNTCISWIDDLTQFHTRTYLCLLFGYSVYISESIKATAIVTWLYDTKFKYYITWRNFSFYVYLQAHRKYKHPKMTKQVDL